MKLGLDPYYCSRPFSFFSNPPSSTKRFSPMASTPRSNQTLHDKNHNNNADASSSYFQTTVCLHDWWLIKPENDVQGKGLAVAGITSREQEAKRVFSSAPINKRYDVFTLETADGVCIVINGFLNKQRTAENGFPSEVFSRFVFGFPPDWEQCVAKFLGGDSTTCTVSGSISDPDKLATHPESLNNSSATSVHFSQEETPLEQVSCADKQDVEVTRQFSPKQSTNITVDDSKVDDLPNYAAEGETCRVNTECSDFQSNGSPKNLGGNQKDLVSRCSMKHKNTKSSPPSEAFESLGGASGATIQSGRKMDISEEYPSYSAGGVSRNLRSKGKEKQMVGSRLNSERNSTDTVPAVSETVNQTLQDDYCEVGGRVEEGESDPKEENTSRKITKRKITFDTNVTLSPPEVIKKVSIVSPESLRRSRRVGGRGMNITVDNSKVDDLPNHAAEEETGRVNIESSDFQSIGRPKNLENSQKNPVSRCSIKHKITKSSPATEAFEILGGASGETIQSGRKMDISEEYPSYSAGRVSRNLRSKGKEKQMVGSRLNSERNTMDSVPAVSETVNQTLQNDNCEVGGRGMSHPSDSELQGKKLDNGCVKDDLQQTSNAKQGQNCRNITAQVGEGESDAKEENTSRKRTKRKSTFDANVTPSLPKVNKKVSIVSPESLSLRRSRSGRLLLPTMEFWRNQMAIYDTDRKVTGIQEDVSVVTTSRGSRSESQKSKNNRG